LPYLQRAIVIAPRQAIAHANLGAAYIKLSKNADAVHELQIAARLEPGNAETQSNLGNALMLTGQPAAAAKAFAIASDAMPGNWDLAYNWALALYEGGAPRQASVVLKKIPTQAMTDQTQALAGDVDEKLGNYKDAVIHYQSAAQINPSDANLYTLTLELLRHWTWDEAIKIANYGATRYPDKTHFKVAVGIALYGSNKYPDAAAAFSKLLIQDPDNGFYADLLGRSCSLVADGANPDCNGLEDFARSHPENAGAATYAAASILHRPATQQDTVKAEQLLNQAIAADPKLPEAYYQLGVLEQQRSHWKESSVALEKAIALRPTYAEAHYRLSRAYAHMGMRDDAQKQIALQQQYSQQEKDNLDSRLQEVVTFLLKPS
jgi:tetratricopeptide (TPR) repeat protein